jgi:3-phenylpropionate/trans-cinnamate dioxygenase ferredoxin component
MSTLTAAWECKRVQFEPVLAEDALAIGQSRCVEVDGDKVLIIRSELGFHAMAPWCSHASLPLEGGRVRMGTIMCPHHGARFELRTGTAKGAPAFAPIAVYPVRVSNGQVEVALP